MRMHKTHPPPPHRELRRDLNSRTCAGQTAGFSNVHGSTMQTHQRDERWSTNASSHTHSEGVRLVFRMGEVPRRPAECRELVSIEQSAAQVTADKQTRSRLEVLSPNLSNSWFPSNRSQLVYPLVFKSTREKEQKAVTQSAESRLCQNKTRKEFSFQMFLSAALQYPQCNSTCLVSGDLQIQGERQSSDRCTTLYCICSVTVSTHRGRLRDRTQTQT